jgi:hypothetical protein
MMLCLMEPRLEFPCQAPPHNNRQSLAHNYVRRSEKRVIRRRTLALSPSRTKTSLRESKMTSICLSIFIAHLRS